MWFWKLSKWKNYPREENLTKCNENQNMHHVIKIITEFLKNTKCDFFFKLGEFYRMQLLIVFDEQQLICIWTPLLLIGIFSSYSQLDDKL